jgi:rod shape determining protein RodA
VEHRIDAWLLLAVIGILGASLATLRSVAPVIGSGLVVRQLLWGVAGLVLMWVVSAVRLDVLERLAPVAYVLGLGALIAVLFLGEVRGGSRAWFALGPFTFQPSEFARLGTILVVAAWLARRPRNRLRVGEVVRLSALVGAGAVLVLAEPDLGVALTYLPVLVAGLWLGGLPTRAWIVLAVIGGLGAGVAWSTVLKPYQKERVLTILDSDRDPWGAGYQVRQSMIAVGSGGFDGQGLGRGSQSQLRFLPAQHTDFVFAVWAEATGFVGSAALLFAYGLLLWRLGVTAAAVDSRFGMCVTVLVLAWFAFQLTVNLGMVLAWLPTTGITLPLFSYGGSSLLTTFAALGLVQSVWRHRLVNQ